MVILMHGIFSSKDYNPMPAFARGLAKAGIASVRFDFGGHGKSDNVVPMWCSEKYLQTYGEKAELIRVEGENHTITRHRREVTGLVVEFFDSFGFKVN